jgi:tetratricopeptide (TPR) repeat protein
MNRKQSRIEQRQARPAPPPARDWFFAAVQHHQAGHLHEAERLYRQVLAADPRHADSLHLLGVIAYQLGRHDAAVDLIGRAIAINAAMDAYHCNLGNALKDLGRLDEAISSYRRALDLKPDFPEAHNNLGNALRETGRLDEAMASYRRALAHRPDFPDARNNLGNLLADEGRVDEAIACFRRALDLRPDHPDAHNNLGNLLKRQGRLDEAIAHFRTALAHRPAFTEAHSNLGGALKEKGRFDEAVTQFRTALDLRPDVPEVIYNLGDTLRDLGQLEAAADCFNQVLRLRPDDPEAHNDLGITLQDLGRLDEAAACYRCALELRPDFPIVHTNLATVLLAQGELAAGWQAFERRWQTPQLAGGRRDLPQPQWRGEPAEGRTLLIHAEQGFGDTLQFCRYAVPAAERGLLVILEVPKPLVRLLGSLPGNAQVVARGEALPAFDLHCPMMSMPLALGTTLETIPAAVPYLHADQAQAEAWRARLAAMATGGLRAGLVWAGNPRSHAPALSIVDRRRSISADLLAPLFDVPGVHFFSLQKEGPAAPAEFPLTDVMSEMGDFADTASLVANLDLVISVDTAVAHLAAALGKPVWLLDRFDACWRWLTGRDDSPWYPGLRIFRQPRPGDWPSVIERVQAELRLLAGDRAPSGGGPAVVSRPAGALRGEATATDAVAAAHHAGLGRLHAQQGRLEQAIGCFRRAIALKPDLPEAHNDLGVALREQGRLDEAVTCFRRALDLAPDIPQVHFNLSNALAYQGRPDEAAAGYRRAIELRPDYADAHNNLGNLLREQGRLEEALACYRRAVQARPDHPGGHNNLGNMLMRLGRPEEALPCFRRAVALGPDYPDAHFNLARLLLAQGELAEGWQEFEWRWQTPDLIECRRSFAQPQWRGEPAAGRTLLIHAEQGFGDTLQFCRYARLAAERGLRVILEVPKPLVRLLRSLAGVDRVLAQGEALPPFDLHCPMLSLPLALGTTLATIPGTTPYLRADDSQIAAWRARLDALANQGLRIGLVWAGSARQHLPNAAAIDRRRSMAPELLAPLFDVPGLQFFSLQKDGPAAPPHFRLIDVMSEMTDFADTAALVENLDLVISVDTAVAHLAAALGRPVWLLDRFDPCWRWLIGRRDTPWYPTLRLFRQPEPGNWASVIEEVRAELHLLAAGRAPAVLAPPGGAASDSPAALTTHAIALREQGRL